MGWTNGPMLGSPHLLDVPLSMLHVQLSFVHFVPLDSELPEGRDDEPGR